MEEEIAPVRVYEKSRSLTITIPKEAAKKAGIKSRMLLSVDVVGDQIILRKIRTGLDYETFSTFINIYEKVLTLINKEREVENLLLKGKLERWEYQQLKWEIIQAREALQKEFNKVINELNKVIDNIKSKIPALRFIERIQSFNDFLLFVSFMEEKEFEENIESICDDINDLKERERTLIHVLQNLERLHNASQIPEEDYQEIRMKFETRLSKINQALDKLRYIIKP